MHAMIQDCITTSARACKSDLGEISCMTSQLMERRCNSDLSFTARAGASSLHVHALTLVPLKQEDLAYSCALKSDRERARIFLHASPVIGIVSHSSSASSHSLQPRPEIPNGF